MQRNPGFDTIEQRLLSALLETELINKAQYLNPREIFFQRAARTDRRVSAIKQAVSLKLPETIRDKINEVNSKLPNDIRVLDVRRTIPSFDSKNYCDARTYNYLMPSFAFMPVNQPQIDKSYRIPDETIIKINSILNKYVGTHSFHNFTSGKSMKDTSSNRVLKSLSCSQPFFPMQLDKNKLEFVLIRLKGQSFMLHQIRKMVGLTIAIIRGYVDESEITRALTEEKVDIPRAPGINLMLEETHYDSYNRRHAFNGPHQPLTWDNLGDEVQKFKEDFIYPVIVDAELNKNSMAEWLETNLHHHYSFEAQEVNKQQKVENEMLKNDKEEEINSST